MLFEWSERKNRANLKKHGVSFEAASLVFHDPFLLSISDDRYAYAEERWQSIGLINDVAIYVAHTIYEEAYEQATEEIIRLISARQATPSEERQYYTCRRYREAN